MHEIILQADDLAVGYGGKAVLKGLSFSLRPGEILKPAPSFWMGRRSPAWRKTNLPDACPL